MTEEIQKYDANVVMQGVKDKIKASFVSLIPDDKWDEMIQAEINRWLKVPDTNWGDKKSEFQKLVDDCMTEILREKVATLLKDKYVSEMWENGEPIVRKEIEEMITENSGKILLSIIGKMVQQTIDNMRNNKY